jgi:dihydrofolate synthase/folylpolyglutamate synthase
MLASILQEAGYKVGLYTSPHLKTLENVLKLMVKIFPKICDFINTNKPFFEANDISFFEMSVGLAFSYFKKRASRYFYY